MNDKIFLLKKLLLDESSDIITLEKLKVGVKNGYLTEEEYLEVVGEEYSES